MVVVDGCRWLSVVVFYHISTERQIRKNEPTKGSPPYGVKFVGGCQSAPKSSRASHGQETTEIWLNIPYGISFGIPLWNSCMESLMEFLMESCMENGSENEKCKQMKMKMEMAIKNEKNGNETVQAGR